ncbi:glycosyltransferase [Methylomicrobium lacus]|uniref:glycosyltransferase n=1 Tax=Methylomicrobium lacus TaxID=136992 RepID=UPI0035A9862B
MKILNVNSSLSFKTGGGTAERTFQMSRFLAREGIDCTVLTIDSGLDQDRIEALKPASLIAFPLLWQRFHVPRIRWKTVKNLVNEADIVHLMGHWGVLNAVVYWAVRRARKPYVVCPAGALPLFGRSKLLKKLYNLIVGKAILRDAAGWIAVTEAECVQFESYGVPSSRITVIPNGVCQEDFQPADTEQFRREKKLPDAPLILFMGRLSPIKGPDLLLQAFASVREQIPAYHLAFAGPDEGMRAGLEEAARQAGIEDRVHFLGFVGGNDKAAAYRAASLLAVPSRQEAMSIVVLEAGICGTPAMLTDQCGFSEITEIDRGLETPATVQGIAEGLLHLLLTPDLLESAASSLRNLVLQKYTWRRIVRRYLNLYQTLLQTSISK